MIRKKFTAILLALSAVAVFVAVAGNTPGSIASADQGAVQKLAEANAYVEAGVALASSGDIAGAKREFDEFHEAWEVVEDDVRSISSDYYIEIEDAIAGIRNELNASPVNASKLSDAFVHLETEIEEFIASADASAGESAVQKLAGANRIVEEGAALASSGDIAGAQREFDEFHEAWEVVEDDVRSISSDYYIEIEDAIAGIRNELNASPVNASKLSDAFVHLETEIEEFIASAPEADGTSSASNSVKLSGLSHYLEAAIAAIDSGDTATALKEVKEFRQDWIVVEGLVKAKSAADYESIENDMARAISQLSANQPDVAAKNTLARMLDTLEPYAQGDLRYGVFDSAVILLREGFEALLIVGALLAFLKKLGQEDKRKWVWAGSGAGVAASIIVAVIATTIFASAAAAGVNREVMEGVTGLLAAGMLIYMSYWLHTNSSLANWRRYIETRVQSALATQRLVSLALIAFLAVFREGAETALFYIGIAPATSTADLLLGILIGIAGLSVIGTVVVLFGQRFPIRPFFSVASALVLYLAFKFVGNGVHALQVAGKVHSSVNDALPDISFFGMHPTWETFLAQLAMVGVVVSVLVWRRLGQKNTGTSQVKDAATV